MNTFFEKLTGGSGVRSSHSQSEEPYVISARETARNNAPQANRRAPPQDATRVRVADEDEQPISVSEEEPAKEEEGELTVDIYDRGDAIVIQSTVAGVRPEDLDVSLTSDTVSIRGCRDKAEQVRDDAYYYKELFWGTFARTVILPEEVDDIAAEAMLKHGLLTIRLPKRKRGTVQKVKVKLS